MIRNFNSLKIWQRSRAFVKTVYLVTNGFPKEEKFGLISQLNRAVVSIPSNIAEGCGRGTDPQLIHFLDVATGSLCELETQIYLSYDLGFVTKEITKELVEEITAIRKMTQKFKGGLGK